MKFILGRKLHMTQLHTEKGMVVPVTVVQAGPCVVSQVRTREKDGYAAVQFSYGQKKSAHKPQRKHVEGLVGIADGRGAAFVKEMRSVSPVQGAERGAVVTLTSFAVGDAVSVTAQSKGKGFAGVVKRHHFHGHPTTHGHKDQERMPGSIGSGGVQHVFRGQRMAGRMGNEQVTVHGLEVISVDSKSGQLMIKGAIPGSRNSFVVIASKEGEMTFEHPAAEKAQEVTQEKTDEQTPEESSLAANE